MEVLVAHPSLNRGGGAEKVCLATVKALKGKGYRVRLATVDRANWHFLSQRFGDVLQPSEEIYLMENMPVQSEFSQALFTLYPFLLKLISCRLSGNDVIVNTCGELVNSIADISYINAVPVRAAYRYSESGYAGIFGWRYITFAYDLPLKVLNRVFGGGVLLVNSSFIREIVKKNFGRDPLVVYPPVDVEKFRSAATSKRENLVVSISRFRHGKRLDLIPRIAKLVKRGEFAILGIVDGASRGTIERLMGIIKDLKVDDRVRLLVNQPFQRLVDVLSSAKVFLQTQPMEAFGMSVAEAMAAGCVPVVPRCGGPWFDILDCKQGLYGFSYSNVEMAAGFIDRLLKDDALRESVAEKASERAAVFDSSIFEEKILDVVDKVYMGKFGVKGAR